MHQPVRHHRQADGDNAAAALGIADGQRSVMQADDLVTHGKTDAAAPGAGGPFIKLFLDMGQILGRDAGAIVPDGDDIVIALAVKPRFDPLAGAAMLGGIIQQIAEHLLEPKIS